MRIRRIFVTIVTFFNLTYCVAQKDSTLPVISETAIYDFVNYYLGEEQFEKCPCTTVTRHLYEDSISIDSTHKISEIEWLVEYSFPDTVKLFLDSLDLEFFRKQIINPPFTKWNDSLMSCKPLKRKKRRDKQWWCGPILSIPLFSLDFKTVFIFSGNLIRWSIWNWNEISKKWEFISGHQMGT